MKNTILREKVKFIFSRRKCHFWRKFTIFFLLFSFFLVEAEKLIIIFFLVFFAW